ncbi:MAG TPA: hypothetical protein PKA41_02790 [Verrucomicrobiota bacterium]|nr:hypothetical protein [Verrucomicrobiota bacterium]
MALALDELGDQLFVDLGDEVGEEPGIESQPEPFNGIDVEGLGRQLLWDEVMPVESFDLMPRDVVHDQVAPLVGIGVHALGEMIQEGLNLPGDSCHPSPVHQIGTRPDPTGRCHLHARRIIVSQHGTVLKTLYAVEHFSGVGLALGRSGHQFLERELFAACNKLAVVAVNATWPRTRSKTRNTPSGRTGVRRAISGSFTAVVRALRHVALSAALSQAQPRSRVKRPASTLSAPDSSDT